MSFNVPADSYASFMGRYSEPLAVRFADIAHLEVGQRAVDVGCGPGALTAQLVRILGPDAVSAVDPSQPFVEATRGRCPGVEVLSGVAEHLPYADAAFDRALAQLVVHFMSDPVQGLREMRRVTRPGGLVAACVWDHAGGGGPLATFWRAARDIHPGVRDESGLAGAREGHLAQLCEAAGLVSVEPKALTVGVEFASLADWWDPFTLGVGPAGAHVARLDEAARTALRARCADLLPQAPFTVTASAWCVRARA